MLGSYLNSNSICIPESLKALIGVSKVRDTLAYERRMKVTKASMTEVFGCHVLQKRTKIKHSGFHKQTIGLKLHECISIMMKAISAKTNG